MISSSGSSRSVELVFGKAEASAALTVSKGKCWTRVFDFDGIFGEYNVGESKDNCKSTGKGQEHPLFDCGTGYGVTLENKIPLFTELCKRLYLYRTRSGQGKAVYVVTAEIKQSLIAGMQVALAGTLRQE